MITETELQSRLFQAENKARELQKQNDILREILAALAEHDFGGRLHGLDRIRLHGWDRIRAYDAICARARAVLRQP